MHTGKNLRARVEKSDREIDRARGSKSRRSKTKLR